MKNFLTLYFIISLLPALLFAEVPEVPSGTEADALIESEMAVRVLRESERKAAIEAVPAFE